MSRMSVKSTLGLFSRVLIAAYKLKRLPTVAAILVGGGNLGATSGAKPGILYLIPRSRGQTLRCQSGQAPLFQSPAILLLQLINFAALGADEQIFDIKFNSRYKEQMDIAIGFYEFHALKALAAWAVLGVDFSQFFTLISRSSYEKHGIRSCS